MHENDHTFALALCLFRSQIAFGIKEEIKLNILMPFVRKQNQWNLSNANNTLHFICCIVTSMNKIVMKTVKIICALNCKVNKTDERNHNYLDPILSSILNDKQFSYSQSQMMRKSLSFSLKF